MQSESYCGLTQEQWDSLLIEAEDLLRDKNLGSHLVGLFPLGNWESGDRSSRRSGLFCLYVDSVDPLINPYLSTTQNRYHRFDTEDGPIVMFEVFQWAKSLLTGSPAIKSKLSVYQAPFQAVIHQDDSLDPILSCAYDYINNPIDENAERLGTAVAALYRYQL